MWIHFFVLLLHLVSSLGCSSSSVVPTHWLVTPWKVWKFYHSRQEVRKTQSWGIFQALSLPKPFRQFPNSVQAPSLYVWVTQQGYLPLKVIQEMSTRQISNVKMHPGWYQYCCCHCVWHTTLTPKHSLPPCFSPELFASFMLHQPRKCCILSESRNVNKKLE